MKVPCPVCDAVDSKVYDHDRNDVGVRYRECKQCSARWATQEVVIRMIRSDTGARYWPKGIRPE